VLGSPGRFCCGGAPPRGGVGRGGGGERLSKTECRRLPWGETAGTPVHGCASGGERRRGTWAPEPPLAGGLLDFDGGTSRGELVLDLLGVVLVDAFLHRLGSALHQVLGLLQTQTGDGADLLDDVDLVGTGVGE